VESEICHCRSGIELPLTGEWEINRSFSYHAGWDQTLAYEYGHSGAEGVFWWRRDGRRSPRTGHRTIAWFFDEYTNTSLVCSCTLLYSVMYMYSVQP